MNTPKGSSKLHQLAPPPFPDAFGRFTVIGSQHQHLGETVSEVHRMCEALRGGDDEPAHHFDIAALLSSWRADLMVHFATEESSSYFGVVASDSPELIAKLAELRADHTAMLETIAELITLAMDPAPGSELGRRTGRLIQQFQAHEQAESKLLREYFQGTE